MSMHELLGQLPVDHIELVSSSLWAASQTRQHHPESELRWPATIYDHDTAQRIDPLYRHIQANTDKYEPVFAGFHDRVFLAAKRDVGSLTDTSLTYTDQQLDSLAADGSLQSGDRLASLSSKRFLSRTHGKLLVKDIQRPLTVYNRLAMTGQQMWHLSSVPEDAIALHSLYRPWQEMMDELQASDSSQAKKQAYRRYLCDIQTAGITNLAAIMYGQAPDKSPDSLLRMMNVAYSLDNPDDPFSKQPFEAAIVQHETEFDWRVIVRTIQLFGRETDYADAIAAGNEMFAERLAGPSDSGSNPATPHRLGEYIELHRPEYFNAFQPPDDDTSLNPAELFRMGVSHSMQAEADSGLRIADRRVVMDAVQLSGETSFSSCAPLVYSMKQSWVTPLLADYQNAYEVTRQTVGQFDKKQLCARDIWDMVNIQKPVDPLLAVLSYSELPPAVRQSYEKWAMHLQAKLPANLYVSLNVVAEDLHTTVGLPMVQDLTAGMTPGLYRYWHNLCEQDFDSADENQRRECNQQTTALLTNWLGSQIKD